MKINFTARHYKATDKLKEYVETEVNKLEKYWSDIIDCDVITDYVKNQQQAEIKIKVAGNIYKAQVTTDDVYKSIDGAVSKLEKQLKKHKDRVRSK